jgi:type I restriction enzyme S subunit
MNNQTSRQLKDFAAPGRSIISGPFGSNIGKRFFQNSGIPIIRGNNLTTDFKKFNDEGFAFLTKEKADELKSDAIKGDILFTAAGTIGQVGIIPENAKYDRYVISNKQLRFRVDSTKADPKYIYYWLASPWIFKAILNRNTGSTVPLINLGIIKSLPISIPDTIDDQKKIANVFALIDQKIELNNKINAELEAMAKLIYDYWFVQFDFPDANGKPYKSSGGKMVYNETLKREIPAGWGDSDLGEIESNIVTGKTPSTKKLENFNGRVPFICIGDVRGNMHITETEMTLSDVGADSQANKYIPEGAICVTCIASPGLVGFATESAQTNQQLNTVVCSEFENRYFLYFYIKDYFRFAKAKSGNTFANMNKGDFSAIKVINPGKEVLIDFSTSLKPIIDKVLVNSRENNELGKLRDWLLPMLMSGQVIVKDLY